MENEGDRKKSHKWKYTTKETKSQYQINLNFKYKASHSIDGVRVKDTVYDGIRIVIYTS